MTTRVMCLMMPRAMMTAAVNRTYDLSVKSNTETLEFGPQYRVYGIRVLINREHIIFSYNPIDFAKSSS